MQYPHCRPTSLAAVVWLGKLKLKLTQLIPSPILAFISSLLRELRAQQGCTKTMSPNIFKIGVRKEKLK